MKAIDIHQSLVNPLKTIPGFNIQAHVLIAWDGNNIQPAIGAQDIKVTFT